MLSPEFCNAMDVRKAVGAMNKSGLLKEKIKAVGVKKEDLVKAFLDSIDSIPEGTPEAAKIPAEALVVYNTIVEGTDPSPEEQEKLKAAKANKAKKAKEPRGPNNEQTAYDIYTKQLAAGASEEAIKTAMTDHFKPYYEARGKADVAFIDKRVVIYTNIAKKRLEAEKKAAEGGATAAPQAAPAAEAPATETTAEAPPAEEPPPAQAPPKPRRGAKK